MIFHNFQKLCIFLIIQRPHHTGRHGNVHSLIYMAYKVMSNSVKCFQIMEKKKCRPK